MENGGEAMLDSINEALRTRILAGTALAAELSGTAAVYAMQAPTNASLPYVIFSLMAGGDDNETQRESVDLRYQVRCVATTAAKASRVADLLRAQLHNAEASMSAGTAWTIYACEHTTAYQFTESEESQTYFYAGGLYRIRASH